MNNTKLYLVLVLVGLLFECSAPAEQELRKKTEAYFAAWNRHDFTHPDFANFKLDTSYVWHGKKEGKGIETLFDPYSGWKQWDIAWNGAYKFQITRIDAENRIVQGNFHETTDFFKIIGMPEGITAVVTFWFTPDMQVKETQYNWSDSNRSMHDLVKPIVAWARENDSLRIQKVYLQDGFVPNKENAAEWKILFDSYRIAMTLPTK